MQDLLGSEVMQGGTLFTGGDIIYWCIVSRVGQYLLHRNIIHSNSGALEHKIDLVIFDQSKFSGVCKNMVRKWD